MTNDNSYEKPKGTFPAPGTLPAPLAKNMAQLFLLNDRIAQVTQTEGQSGGLALDLKIWMHKVNWSNSNFQDTCKLQAYVQKPKLREMHPAPSLEDIQNRSSSGFQI